jgi:tetratricopeptide (TPR) repeat protein/arylsulfatase A-like enzyme
VVRSNKKFLLVGWDGADPKFIASLLEQRQLPVLERLVERGLMGKAGTLAPALSPLLWASVATGKRPDKHGILTDRVLNHETGAVEPVSARHLTATPVWRILQANGLRTHVVNWPATHPAPSSDHGGVVVTDRFWSELREPGKTWPLTAGSVVPGRLADALADFRIHPAEIRAADLLPFVPRLREFAGQQDGRLSALAVILAETASVHAAATWLLEHEPWDFAAIHYPGLERLGAGFARYLPPVPKGHDPDDRLADVLTAGYRFHDQMLGRLLELAGDDTTIVIVSDHGIHHGDRRPSPRAPAIAWHHGPGFLCIAGPGTRQDDLLHGATILDVAPTVLTHFGLPVGNDMDGRALVEVWSTPPTITRIETWDTHPREAEPTVERGVPHGEEDEALAELYALGYGERAASVLDRIDRQLRRFASGNLALAHIQAGRFDAAAGILRRLRDEDRENYVAALYLAFCLYQAGDLAGCRALLDEIPPTASLGREQALLTALVLIAERRSSEAIDHLREAAEGILPDPAVLWLLGCAWLEVTRYDEAEQAFERALAANPDFADAHVGLARVHAKRRQWDDVVDHTLSAVTIEHHRPVAHYLLGVALFNLNLPDRALLAFRNALQLAPGWKQAERWVYNLQHGLVPPPLEARDVRLRI